MCRPVKGVLNRRFKRVFGFFCRPTKEPEESGGEKPPGQVKNQLPCRCAAAAYPLSTVQTIGSIGTTHSSRKVSSSSGVSTV